MSKRNTAVGCLMVLSLGVACSFYILGTWYLQRGDQLLEENRKKIVEGMHHAKAVEIFGRPCDEAFEFGKDMRNEIWFGDDLCVTVGFRNDLAVAAVVAREPPRSVLEKFWKWLKPPVRG